MELRQGDRGGLCLTSTSDTIRAERGLLVDGAHPLRPMSQFIAAIRPISHFRSPVPSRSKLHITAAHTTVLGTVLFFTTPQQGSSDAGQTSATAFPSALSTGCLVQRLAQTEWPDTFDPTRRYVYVPEVAPSSAVVPRSPLFALVRLERRQTMTVPVGGLILGSKLDLGDHEDGTCRIAFFGKLLVPLSAHDQLDPRLFIGRSKTKTGTVSRVSQDASEIIGSRMFTSLDHVKGFEGHRVTFPLRRTVTGIIDRPFGKAGKFVVRVVNSPPVAPNGSSSHEADNSSSSQTTTTEPQTLEEGCSIVLHYDVDVLDGGRASKRQWDTEIGPMP